ncbi:hypothetical protein Taro_024497, partial [Colocasia esculenta]|nr:hypothetical protein [Colocasia esculenta]
MSLPPREERTRWGLLVGLAVSSLHRTARTQPLHGWSVTLLSTAASIRGRHPKTAGSSERAREKEGERRGERERERGKGLGRPGFKPGSCEGDIAHVVTGTRSHLVAFTRHRQSRTDTKDARHVCQTVSGATRWEGDIGHVAFKKATYTMLPSIKPEGDSGYVAFKKATYPMSQSQAEPDIDAIGTTSRQSPCRDPEDGAKGPRGPGCYRYSQSCQEKEETFILCQHPFLTIISSSLLTHLQKSKIYEGTEFKTEEQWASVKGNKPQYSKYLTAQIRVAKNFQLYSDFFYLNKLPEIQFSQFHDSIVLLRSEQPLNLPLTVDFANLKPDSSVLLPKLHSVVFDSDAGSHAFDMFAKQMGRMSAKQ